MSRILAYRALMPSHYVPRRDGTGTPGTGRDASRKWVATRLPRIRVFGPFWSFGFNCHETPKTAGPDGDVPVLRGLRAFSETSASRPNPQLAEQHDPTKLRVQVTSFLQVSSRPEFSESRMSLLAIRTIHPDRIGGNGQLTKFEPDDFPVADGSPVVGWAEDGITVLDVAPIGDRQPKPETIFRQDKNGVEEVAAIDTQHLPATQLIHGQVRFRPTAGYLAKVREALGLDAPSNVEDGDMIVLLPSGFALAGAIRVPWMKEEPVSGWFKVTFRWLDHEAGRKPWADDAPVDGDPEPVLRPWIGPDGGDALGRAGWDEVIARFEAVLRNARESGGAPRWLDIRPNVGLKAEALFWPLAYDGTEAEPSILLRRQAGNVLGIDGAGLLARLADRPIGEKPVAALTIEPRAFLVTDTGSGLTIATETAPAQGRDVATASYSYARDGRSPQETISIGRLDEQGRPAGRLELVVPLIDTADSLRQAMGLPRPVQTTRDDRILPPLWAFTPLDEGWLHWPLPNATPGILSRLVGAGVPPPPDRREDAGDGISGAILFGNRPGNPGYRPGERNWSLSIGEPRRGSMSVTLELVDEERPGISEASVELSDFAMTFDGVVPVTPFRQTPERLLPDHAERALTTIGLKAVLPSGLTRLEHDLWMTEGAPRFTVALDAFEIRHEAVGNEDAGEMRNRVAAGLSWSLTMPAATKRDVPWIWVRHASMPTVQTMPLAVAGKARSTPGEARALAPFVYEGDGTRLIYACKAGTLDMTRHTVPLDPGVAGSVGAGRFRRPPADGRWREEIGMAVTTLPSLTLFPGIAAGAPGVATDAGQWSAYPSYAVTVLARHDIALRDAFHALAVAPTDPEPGAEPPPPPLFTPLAGNGPYGGGTTNGYDRVWIDLSRKAGLAALDLRDMLAAGEDATHLVGLFGETVYPVGKVGFDFGIGLTRHDKAIVAVTQVGAWSLDGLADVEPARITLAGLPQGSDLTGLSGCFKRGESGQIEIRYGTAVLKPKDGVFTDQHGIEVGRPSRPGEASKDAVVKVATSRVLNRKQKLLTMVKPLPVRRAGSTAFWCADVPVGSGDGSFLDAYAKSPALRLDGASLDNDPFAGFRWTLADPDAPDDAVVIDGLVFEPLALEGLTLDAASGALDKVTIGGRLLLQVGDAESPTLPSAGGVARLTLTADEDGHLVPWLEGRNIVWPLVDPQSAIGFVPTLSMAALPEQMEGAAAHLSFGFADAIFSIELTLTWSADTKQLLCGRLKGDVSGESELGIIATEMLELTIGRAGNDARGKRVLLQSHGAKLAFASQIGPRESRMVGELTHELLAAHESVTLEGITLRGPAGAVLDVEVDVKNGEGSAAAFAFGADHIAVRWRLPDTKPQPMLLEGLAISGGEGAIFATLALDTREAALKALPRFRLTGLEDEALYALTTSSGAIEQPGPLHWSRRRRSGESRPVDRLFGTIAVVNAFSWPLLSVTAAGAHFEEASLPAKSDRRIAHRAVITFGGGAVGSDAGSLLISAAVAHTIETTAEGEQGAETWTWQSHQQVRLLPRQAFLAHLGDFRTPASRKPDDLRKLATGFSPFVGPGGAPLTDYAAVPHFLHVAASGPGGIAGPLADQLLAAIEANPMPFLAVDLSSHFVLDFQAAEADPRAGGLIFTSLPAIGFCIGKAGELPWAGVDAITMMLATEVATDTRILQSTTDGIEARRLPPLEQAVADSLTTGLGKAGDHLDETVAPLADRDGPERRHRPVFQAVVLRRNEAVWQPAWELPGAATAMHLSALLDGRKRGRSPVALTFRSSGGISGDDLFARVRNPKEHPLRKATRIDVGDYGRAMRRFRERVVRDLVAGPGAAAPRPSRLQAASVRLRLVARARDGDGPRMIVEQRETVPEDQLATVLDRVPEWGRLSLVRLAPWAAAGLAAVSFERQGVPESRTAIIRRERPAAGRSLSPQPISENGGDVSAQRQREKVARPMDGAARITAGYTPLAAEPRLFTSEPDWTYGEDEPDYRLTANGTAMVWSLAGGGGAALGDVKSSARPCAFWLTDRYRPAFRHFAKSGPEITFALPEDYRARLPASLVPANHATPRLTVPDYDVTGTAQSFAPALATTSRIASRPGAVAATRTGLVAVYDDRNGPAMLDASQVPLAVRQPRPPILARNDRARASSHEPEPFHLSREPTVILHGPRVAPFGASALPVGLDRRPRSKSALRLVLASPKAGIAGPGWGGEVEVAIDAAFGDPDEVWTIRNAAIVIGADRYVWRRSAGDATEIGTGKTIRLIDFRGNPSGRGPEQSARDGLRAVPAATSAAIEITVAYGVGGLLRRIRFDILGAGAGMAVPGVEAPLFFRFDDPEYNDQLQGIAKLARESSPSSPGDDFVFAADMDDIRPAQRLELALALRPAKQGAATSLKFESKAGRLAYGGVPLLLTIRRQRPGKSAATSLAGIDQPLEGAKAVEKQWGSFHLMTEGDPTVFHAMKLDCALLREEGSPTQPGLAPGDQLELMIMQEEDRDRRGKGKALVTLRFDVVATPDMPANPSSFGVLMLTPDGKSVPVHLFASGPEATVIELVDPLDLVEGVVRRRAIYQWRSFHHAAELNGTNEGNPTRFTLQKIGGSGGSWLSGDISTDWLPAGES